MEAALPLAKGLHQDIVSLGRRVEQAARAGEAPDASSRRSIEADRHLEELRAIIDDMKDLLARIDNDIPLLHMAITTSGESLNSSLSSSISPSRLLQAGMFLTFGDTQFAADPSRSVQIGPVFTLSIYMLFLGHAAKPPATRPGHREKHPQTPQTPRKSFRADPTEPYGFEDEERKPLWQEVIHKARVRLCRTPMDHVFDPNKGFRQAAPEKINKNFDESQFFESNAYGMGQRSEYAYHLEIIEDMDDGRAHDDLDAEVAPYDDIRRAGIRESIPIHQISKIFYADTGRILNIGGDGGIDNNPVLLLKRDILAKPPLQMQEEMMTCGDEAEPITTFESGTNLNEVDEQDDIDRQLREESAALDMLQEMPVLQTATSRRSFPNHLDPEWIALEVFEEDGSESSETEDEDVAEETRRLPLNSTSASTATSPMNDTRQSRASLDSKLMAQIQNLSLQSSPSIRDVGPRASMQPFSQDLAKHSADSTKSFVARSPFGGVVTSLSLMEMLIRLTSLQEFQQASHLTIHDHILNFFLEETSTTGLKGEERLRARTEAKQRVGFDPYTDTPSR